MKKQVIVTRESLQAMLDNADTVKRQHIVGRALVALFDRQTQDEKRVNDTRLHNNIGFQGCDAKSGSITAKTYLARGELADWQVERWTKRGSTGFSRLCKYAKQLNEIAIAKAQKEII